MKQQKQDIEYKIKNLFWDLSSEEREIEAKNIIQNPFFISQNKALKIRVLTGLNWFDLTKLFTLSEIYQLLSDDVLNSLFPKSLRNYYSDAKRLLSKYIISSSR